MEWDFSNKSIRGEKIILEPMRENNFEAVCASLIPDPDGWYTRMFGLNNRDAYKKEFSDANKFRNNKTGMGFVIRDIISSQVAGISFFLKMDSVNRSVEIGTTNIAPRFRRTHVNTSAKLTMLTEAFEVLKCVRVCFRVDEENLISINAIERLGV